MVTKIHHFYLITTLGALVFLKIGECRASRIQLPLSADIYFEIFLKRKYLKNPLHRIFVESWNAALG